jgi:succinyl-diaminopimelate desuccinylase
MAAHQHYTVEDLARQLQVSRRTILREIHRGKLPAHKAGRRFLISPAQLQTYLRSSSPSQDHLQAIHRFCRDHQSEMVVLLQKLVSFPSESAASSQVEDLARYLKHTLEKFRFRSSLFGLGTHPTVRATFGYAEHGLLFNCPIDAVPAGDLQHWDYPPYDGVIKDGMMYGRGTADCKAGIVAMLYALLALRQVVDERALRIELVFDSDEQTGNYQGMRLALQKGLDVSAGVIGYAADSPHELTIGARGYHRYLFTAHGRSAHTGARFNLGVNAIDQMIKFIQEMNQVNLPRPGKGLFPFGPRLTFSTIHGGTTINVVPDLCQAQLDVRTTPELNHSQLQKIIDRVISHLKRQSSDFNLDYQYLVGHEAYQVKPKDPVVTTFQTAIKHTLHLSPRLSACGPSHTGNLLAEHHIPVIIWGPRGTNVHAYNEYVDIHSLPATAEIYAQAALNFFGIK